MRRIIPRHSAAVLLALAILPGQAVQSWAQQRFHAGGSVGGISQGHSGETGPAGEPLGGTTWSGSLLFGLQVSPRLAVEFEPSVAGQYSWEYSYIPCLSCRLTRVVPTRRSTFYTVQLRGMLGVLEPVGGLSYVHARVRRDYSATYSQDAGTDNELAAVVGIDLAFKIARRLWFVPTFRAILLMGPRSSDSFDPLEEQTRTGRLAMKYGAGMRIAF
jgi:hypothetical protein